MSTPDLSRDERTFHQVLELLKGPTDERRSVVLAVKAGMTNFEIVSLHP